MRKHSNRNGLKKERAVMVASTVLVLSALTVTGIYVRKDEKKAQDNGYTIDLSSLEQEEIMDIPEVAEESLLNDSDLDYDPDALEVDSGDVTIGYGLKQDESITAMDVSEYKKENETKTETPVEEELANAGEVGDLTKDGKILSADAEAGEEVARVSEEEGSLEAVSTNLQETLNFTADSKLVLPIAGEILINYSTDKSVYFPTLEQYRCNPALIISASQGEQVKAAVAGRVVKIYEDAVTGKTVVMDLGNGYELTYGQLADVTVSEGSYVPAGENFAVVAAPTRYFVEEGTNLYLKLTKDGIAINPAQ
ncbi:MAG: hypothetical protein E7299_09345 [Lachnospiraceae bacterium]|nr:hypothetical protein [Lachnospiraceae bacterium]